MTAIQYESKLIATGKNKILRNIGIALFGSILLAISAQITIPIQPVPVTLQTFAVLLIGMAFGPKMGTTIILAYLVEGILGLPVFADFSWGLPILLGPTGGYLLGFIPAAFVAGYLLQKGWVRHRITIFLAAVLGTITLIIPGYLVLANFVGFHNAYLFGVAPFYIVEACKLAVFTLITPIFWRQKHKNI